MPAVAVPWFFSVLNSTEEAISVNPVLVTVNFAVSPSVTSILSILYTIFGLSSGGNGTPPINPIVVVANGCPVYASSQTYCV